MLDYFYKDWANLLQTDQQNVNLSMDSFLNNINSILDVHTHQKKVNKYKLKFKTKKTLDYPCTSEINFYRKQLTKKS